MQSRWTDLYNFLINSENHFRNEVLRELKKYIEMESEQRNRIIHSNDPMAKEDFDIPIKYILRNIKSSSESWEILREHFYVLENIKDLNIYRNALNMVYDPIQNTAFTYLKDDEVELDTNKMEPNKTYKFKIDDSEYQVSKNWDGLLEIDDMN